MKPKYTNGGGGESGVLRDLLVRDSVLVDYDEDGWEGEFLLAIVFVEFGFGGFSDCAGAVAKPEEGGDGLPSNRS